MKRNSVEYATYAKINKRDLGIAVTLPHGEKMVPLEFWVSNFTSKGVFINLLTNGGLDTDESKAADSPHTQL